MAVSGDVMVALETSSTEDAASTVVRTSSDGATWQVATRLDVRLWSIATADNRFVAAGSRDSDDGRDIPVAATSPDGSHWHVTDLGCEVAGVAHDVAETPAGLVAVGSTSSRDGLPRPATWSSEDGVTWRAGSPEGFGDVVGGIRHVATAGSAVVAVGERQPDHGIGPQLAWWSDDGHRWNPSTPPQHWDGGVLAGDMASGSAGAVLVGTLNNSLGTAWAWRTTDGRSWESVALPALPGTGTSFPSDVASDGRRWVAVSDDVVDSGPTPGRHPGVWVSDDATSWRRVPMTDLDGPALQSLTDAKAVVVRDDRWFVYGTTTPEVDAPSGVEWVLWRGR